MRQACLGRNLHRVAIPLAALATRQNERLRSLALAKRACPWHGSGMSPLTLARVCLPAQVRTTAIKIVRAAVPGFLADADHRSLDIPEIEAFGSIFIADASGAGARMDSGLDDVGALMSAHSNATVPVIPEDCDAAAKANHSTGHKAVYDTHRLMSCGVSTAAPEGGAVPTDKAATTTTPPQEPASPGDSDGDVGSGDQGSGRSDGEALGSGVIAVIAVAVVLVVALVLGIAWWKARQGENARLPTPGNNFDGDAFENPAYEDPGEGSDGEQTQTMNDVDEGQHLASSA